MSTLSSQEVRVVAPGMNRRNFLERRSGLVRSLRTGMSWARC